jgi:hypothetical protein
MCTALTLELRPGRVPGATIPIQLGKPAADIPPGPIAARLPLYAGSYPASPAGRTGGFILPASYRKVAVAGFSAEGSVDHIYSWYHDTLRACGFSIYGEATPGPHPTDRYLGLEAWFPQAAFPMSLGEVGLTILREPAGTVRITYVVQALSLPPRPQASFLRGPFVRVGIVFHSRGLLPGANYVRRFTIIWQPTIARLVAAINRPGEIAVPGLGVGGVIVSSTSATLYFTRADGGVRPVQVDSVSVTLTVGHTRPLDDTDGKVMHLVARITTRRCPSTSTCA